MSLVDVGKNAFWSVSSAKEGNGVREIVDNDVNTFWQSDGLQPHEINIQFKKITRIKTIDIYLNHEVDDSYTPRLISILGGTTISDLKPILSCELVEPCGWTTVKMTKKDSILVNFVQIQINGNHLNGKDTHVRQVKIFGPKANLNKLTTNKMKGFGRFR